MKDDWVQFYPWTGEVKKQVRPLGRGLLSTGQVRKTVADVRGEVGSVASMQLRILPVFARVLAAACGSAASARELVTNAADSTSHGVVKSEFLAGFDVAHGDQNDGGVEKSAIGIARVVDEVRFLIELAEHGDLKEAIGNLKDVLPITLWHKPLHLLNMHNVPRPANDDFVLFQGGFGMQSQASFAFSELDFSVDIAKVHTKELQNKANQAREKPSNPVEQADGCFLRHSYPDARPCAGG